MSFLTRLSLANRGLVALIALVITGFGLFAIPSLKQQLFPSIELPTAFVGASLPGAGPEIIQQQITKPIEDAVKGVDGIDQVTSTTREGAASIQVAFAFGTDLDSAVNQVTTAINRIQPTLPSGVTPTIFAGGTDDIPAIVLAASGGGMTETQLFNKLNTVVVPELNAIGGVRETNVSGARDLQVLITPDQRKLGAAGVDPRALGTLLQDNGVSVPAGAVLDGPRSLAVQSGTPLAKAEDLGNLYLAGKDGPVRLGDVATVKSDLPPATSYTRTDGVASLGISVTANPDGNPVDISHQVRDKLADLEADTGAKLTVVTDQAPFVESSIKNLTTEGLLGLVMAVIVILVFLFSIRSTLVTAVSIPLSVLIALIALWMGDFTLNLLTLGALTIAVGRVVDDSIVVLENIKRHLEYGEPKSQAIMSAVREVSGAVTASTLTTVAVFAPIALVGGLIGQIFASFAITVTVALLASLVVSLTVVPVLAYWFLKPPPADADIEAIRHAAEEKERRSLLQRSYLPIIRFATVHRVITLVVGLLVLAGTSVLAAGLKTNFLDQSGQNTVSITQEMPVGTDLATTNKAAEVVEGILKARTEVQTFQVTVGSGSFNPFGGSSGAAIATYSVSLKEGSDTAKVTDQLADQMRTVQNAGVIKVAGDSSGLGGSQLSVVVQAADADGLANATEMVRKAMSEVPRLTEVESSLAGNVPRVDVTVKRKEAASFGLTEASIGQSVANAFQPRPIGQITIDGTSQDVIISGGAPPVDQNALRNLSLATDRGAVKLSQVADVKVGAGPEEVTRIDGARSATVNGTATDSNNVGAATSDLTAKLKALDLPPGASYTIGGVSADQSEAFQQLGLAVLAAIAIVFIIMVATFRSIVQPIILLVSIPFAATGAIGLLLLTDTAMGVPALIGVLMLVGIVVTNAIVLLDLINHYRAEGMSVQQAVIEGGRHRLRPILMTAIATVFALLPMALGLTGEGGFISRPLAIVVIGGLVSSTLLTLVLVPTLYTMVENGKERRRRRRADRRARRAAVKARRNAPAPEAPKKGAPAGHVMRGYTDQFGAVRRPRPGEAGR